MRGTGIDDRRGQAEDSSVEPAARLGAIIRVCSMACDCPACDVDGWPDVAWDGVKRNSHYSNLCRAPKSPFPLLLSSLCNDPSSSFTPQPPHTRIPLIHSPFPPHRHRQPRDRHHPKPCPRSRTHGIIADLLQNPIASPSLILPPPCLVLIQSIQPRARRLRSLPQRPTLPRKTRMIRWRHRPLVGLRARLHRRDLPRP